jgi:hypothetical protein
MVPATSTQHDVNVSEIVGKHSDYTKHVQLARWP